MLKIPKLLQLHIIILLWGFTPVLGKLITLPANELVIYRLLFAGITLWVYMLVKKSRFKYSWRAVLEMLIMGGVVGIHWYSFYQAIKVSNVSMAMAGFSTITFFASILQPILLNKKFFIGDLIYGVFILIGIGIILNYESLYLEGIIYGTIAAFSGAFFGVYNGRLIKKHEATGITLIEFIGALLTLIIAELVQHHSLSLSVPDGDDLFYLIILSVLCTTVAYTWSVEILNYFSPFTIIITNNLEPIYGVIFSVLLFGSSEYMSGGFYIGAAIILFSIFSYPFIQKKFNR